MRRGLKVGIKPNVILSSGNYSAITGSYAWFNGSAGYCNYINHYATIAAQKNVDMLALGTELCGASYQTAEWNNLINGVKKIYTGPLTYAGTHWEPATGRGVTSESTSWWNRLDDLGINAYYPLTTTFSPTLGQLNTAWAGDAQTIDGWWKALPAKRRSPSFSLKWAIPTRTA